MNRLKKGFTLIELLVVIAIIGVLAGIVLAALNTARRKGNDAATKGNLSSIRVQAELYYDNNTGYSSAAIATLPAVACNTANSVFLDTTVASAITAAQGSSGTAPTCAVGGTSGQKANSWAVAAPLLAGVANDYWCVDSLGAGKVLNTAAITTNGANGIGDADCD